MPLALAALLWGAVLSPSPLTAFEAYESAYYPIAVGHEWTWEVERFAGEGPRTFTFSRGVHRSVSDEISGTVAYYDGENRRLALQTADGMMDDAGFRFLGSQPRKGSEWVSEAGGIARSFSVVDAGGAVTVRGVAYGDCVVIENHTAELTTVTRQGAVGRRAWGETVTYCRGYGPVRTLRYEITPEGNLPEMKVELVSFRTGKPVHAPPAGVVSLIEREKSFGFPKRGYLHPAPSPDEKWVVYQHESTMGQELYYSRLGAHEQRLLPLWGQSKERHVVEKAGETIAWSGDGRHLATTAVIDARPSIIILEFDATGAQLVEAVAAQDGASGLEWDRGNLYFVDEQGAIQTKRPRESPRLVQAPARGRIDGIITGIQVRAGRLLFQERQPRYGPRPEVRIFIADPGQPSSRAMLASGTEAVTAKLSNDGEYVFVREGWTRSRIVGLATGKDAVALGRCTSVKWSPVEPRLACSEWRDNREASPPGTPGFLLTHHFLIADARAGKVEDYGFRIPEVFNWTPDGQHIIHDRTWLDPSWQSYRPGVTLTSISDGSEVGRVSRFAGDSVRPPALSPSGTWLTWDCHELRSFFLVPNPLDAERFRKRQFP